MLHDTTGGTHFQKVCPDWQGEGDIVRNKNCFGDTMGETLPHNPSRLAKRSSTLKSPSSSKRNLDSRASMATQEEHASALRESDEGDMMGFNSSVF
jgi:hypothetical protein